MVIFTVRHWVTETESRSWTQRQTENKWTVKRTDVPVQCGGAAGWWLWKRPSAYYQTRLPPPGSYHRRTAQRNSETDGELEEQTDRQAELKQIETDRFSAHIILFGPSPEVGSSCITWDVEDSDALQTRQRDRSAVTLSTNDSQD